jgi:hypothetical protein
VCAKRLLEYLQTYLKITLLVYGHPWMIAMGPVLTRQKGFPGPGCPHGSPGAPLLLWAWESSFRFSVKIFSSYDLAGGGGGGRENRLHDPACENKCIVSCGPRFGVRWRRGLRFMFRPLYPGLVFLWVLGFCACLCFIPPVLHSHADTVWPMDSGTVRRRISTEK